MVLACGPGIDRGTGSLRNPTCSVAIAKMRAAAAKMMKAQRQVRKASTSARRSGPPKAEMPQTTESTAMSCGQTASERK